MTKREFKFENGNEVIDQITGFKGQVTGSVYYITGCNQYLVTPKTKEHDKLPECNWLDEDRLLLIEATKSKLKNSDNGPMRQAPIK